jgi:hypothetical protein
MRIRHPFSFFLMIVVMIGTATLSVSFSLVHILGLLAVLGLIVLLRFMAFMEGRHENNPHHYPWNFGFRR